MASNAVHVCVSCRIPDDVSEIRAGARLFALVRDEAEASGHEGEVLPVECMANCDRSCSVAFAESGKWTYLFGRLAPDSGIAGDILTMAREHAAAEDGVLKRANRPTSFLKGLCARLPPLKV